MKLEMNRIGWPVVVTSQKQKGNSMRNKPIQHATILALAGLCGVLFLQTSSRADVVDPGFDLFTFPDTSFDGVVWAGVPLGTYNFGGSIGVQNVGNTDTIVRRLGTSGTGQTVPLQVDALQLVSATPSFGGQYGFITLDPNDTSGGTITCFTATPGTGGTYSAQLHVYYDLHIGSLAGPVYTSGEVTEKGSGDWQHNPPPGSLLIPGVNDELNGTDTSADFWPVPEPSSLALLGIGAVSLLARKWRRLTA
jgi:hypothetical protein